MKANLKCQKRPQNSFIPAAWRRRSRSSTRARAGRTRRPGAITTTRALLRPAQACGVRKRTTASTERQGQTESERERAISRLLRSVYTRTEYLPTTAPMAAAQELAEVERTGLVVSEDAPRCAPEPAGEVITVGSHVHGRYPQKGGIAAHWRRATVVAVLDDTKHHNGALGNGGPGYRLEWTGVADDDDSLFEIRELAAPNVRVPTDENDAYIRLNHGPGSATCLGRLFPAARETLARGLGVAEDDLSAMSISLPAAKLLFGVMWALQVYIAFHISTGGFRVEVDLVRALILGVNSTEPIQGIERVNGTVANLPHFETLLPGILGYPFLVTIVALAFRILGLACGTDCGGPGARSLLWAFSSLLTVVPACFFAATHTIVRAEDVPSRAPSYRQQSGLLHLPEPGNTSPR